MGCVEPSGCFTGACSLLQRAGCLMEQILTINLGRFAVGAREVALTSRVLIASCAFLLGAAAAGRARAEGEATNGFPNWNERVLVEWVNRARSDPQVEMTACGANCGDGACYAPIAPVRWDAKLAHAARFHVDNMIKMSYFGHTSACTLASNIGATYPGSCDGSASCACEGGVATCNPVCTDFSIRVSLFGGSAGGETLTFAGFAGPDAAFYARLFESAGSGCGFSASNGDRWSILTATGLVGAGMTDAGSPSNLEFGFGAASTSKIPSGAHFPQQASSVDAWANWYDAAGPSVAKIDVEGVCSDMTLNRGSLTNGAWHAVVIGAGSGCHHYVFAFKDGGGSEVIYPTTGALTIGDGSALCPDFSNAPPRGCPGFDRIFTNGLDP